MYTGLSEAGFIRRNNSVTQSRLCVWSYTVYALQVENTSESDPCSYEATWAVKRKAQKLPFAGALVAS